MVTGFSSNAVFSLLDPASPSQSSRLLRLQTPLADVLAVERMTVREGVNALFQITIDCVAPSSQLDVARLLGEEISLRLILADDTYRNWHGIVQEVDALGADGGLARYRITAMPWLAALGLRRDSYLFQDKSAVDILAEIFADYSNATFSFDVSAPPAVRPIRTQYRESDLDFVLRILAEEGLNFRFEHIQGDDAGGSGAPASRHRLVVFDYQAAQAGCSASPIRFHRTSATEAEDGIARFVAERTVQPNAVVRSAWDDTALVAHAGQATSSLPAGEVPILEDYDPGGHGRYTDGGQAERSAQARLRAHDARLVRFSGAGSVRAMAPGESFQLTQNDRYAAAGEADQGTAGDQGNSHYTILAVMHEAANNLGTQATQILASGDLEAGAYRNTFIAQPQVVPMAPEWRAKPSAPEAMIAVVVSAQGAPLSTGRDLRIKVQFPWQRGAAPVAGGLRHSATGADPGNAPGDERSGTWLRMANSMAGANWGAHSPPRSGTEVLIDFLDSDIDQPLVAAQLYNDSDTPPWAAGVDADANHPGTLAGWHSQELGGSGYNQWVVDDASGQLRMRLACSTASTQLGLGYLIDQDGVAAGRGAWRGTGFELRTDAWTALRSGQGLLLSARAQENAGATQSESNNSLALLRGAQAAAQRIDTAATQRHGQAMAANAAFADRIAAFDTAANARYPATVNGQAGTQASGATRDGGRPVDRIDGAHVLLESPNSVAMNAAAAISLFAGEHVHATAQADTHIAAQHTFAGAAGRAASIFVQQGSVMAVAATSPLSVQANTGALEMLAGQDVTITSTSDMIEILAKSAISFVAAGASITLKGSDVLLYCPGTFSVKGSAHSLSGAASDPAALPALPSQRASAPSTPLPLMSSKDEDQI